MGRRALQETVASIRWDTPVRLVIALGTPAVTIALAWFVFRQTAITAVVSVAFVASVGALLFLVKLWQIPPEMESESAVAIAVLSKKLDLALAEKSPVPDMTIGELFFHINPDVLDDTGVQPEPWRVVGDEVSDALSIGRMEAWGRSIGPNSHRGPLTAIDRDYWSRARFTLQFFRPEDDRHVHVDLGPHTVGGEYADLRVSRAQAVRIWPVRD